jgi:biopolymer transport protein ExbD
MRSRHSHRSNKMPEVNLVPMMDVLMTVLTFFIVITMLMTVDKTVNTQLPSNQPDRSNPQPNMPDPFVAQLDQKGVRVKDTSMDTSSLIQAAKTYLGQNPKGIVALQVAPEVPYEKVVDLLGQLKEMGGDRVTLAIE